MKKFIILSFALITAIALSACGGTNVDELQNGVAEQPQTFTAQQIQQALQPQFEMGIPPQEPQQVLAVERVERVREGFRPEGAGPGPYTYDLTNSFRYRVTYSYKPYPEDYDFWTYNVEFWANNPQYWDGSEPPTRFDGEFIILIGYFYFNEVNGEPELAFITC